MRKLIISLVLSVLSSFPALANWTGKDATPATITFYNPGACTSVVCTPVMQITDGTNQVTLTTAGADGVSNTLTGVPEYARMLQFNGNTWDRWQGAIKAALGAYAAGAFAAGAGVDGWDLTQGAIADAAVAAGATGSVSAKLRAISRDIASIITNTAAAIPTQAVTVPIGGVSNDPCQYGTKTNFTIATSSGTVQLVAPSGSTQVYICSLFSIGATASIQNIVGGTGASCTTGTPVAMAGSTTAASGMSFAANGGFTFGNGGGTVLRTTTAGHGVCLIQSATAAIAGGGTFVQQ